MSSIFSSTISSGIDHSAARLRSIIRTDAQAERVLSAAVAAIAAHTGELPADIEADIRWQANGSQMTARPAVKLVSSALSAIESALTTRHSMGGIGEGFEAASPVSDCRAGGMAAERILLAA